MNRLYHIYECAHCDLVFAVLAAYDHSYICCPDCKTDDHLTDVGHGWMSETHYPSKEVDTC